MRIEIRAYHQTGPNGDRYRGPGVPYFDYKVFLLHDDGKEIELHAWRGFDDMWTCPKPKEQLALDVAVYAKKQAQFFGCETTMAEVGN